MGTSVELKVWSDSRCNSLAPDGSTTFDIVCYASDASAQQSLETGRIRRVAYPSQLSSPPSAPSISLPNISLETERAKPRPLNSDVMRFVETNSPKIAYQIKNRRNTNAKHKNKIHFRFGL